MISSPCSLSLGCPVLSCTPCRPGLSVTVTTVSRDLPVHTMRLMPNNPDLLLVCVKGPQAFLMTSQGQVVRSFSSGKLVGGDFVCATTSPQGKVTRALHKLSNILSLATKTNSIRCRVCGARVISSSC